MAILTRKIWNHFSESTTTWPRQLSAWRLSVDWTSMQMHVSQNGNSRQVCALNSLLTKLWNAHRCAEATQPALEAISLLAVEDNVVGAPREIQLALRAVINCSCWSSARRTTFALLLWIVNKANKALRKEQLHWRIVHLWFQIWAQLSHRGHKLHGIELSNRSGIVCLTCNIRDCLKTFRMQAISRARKRLSAPITRTKRSRGPLDQIVHASLQRQEMPAGYRWALESPPLIEIH